MTGNNTYRGGTTVEGGTLLGFAESFGVTGDNAQATANGKVTVNGGTFGLLEKYDDQFTKKGELKHDVNAGHAVDVVVNAGGTFQITAGQDVTMGKLEFKEGAGFTVGSEDVDVLKEAYAGKAQMGPVTTTGVTGADLAVANPDYVASYGDSGLFENLDPYLEGTGYDTDDFSAGLLLSSQFEGKQVALPFLHSTQVIYYNKTMADANGWTIPEKIEDFTPFLAEVHKTAGVYGTVVPGWDQWYFETMYLNEGVQIITDDNTCDLGSDTALGVTSMIKDWCDAGDAYFATGTDASAAMRQNFYDQKTFSVMHTSSLYNNYVSKCPDFEVGMAWYPAASTGDKNSEVGGCVLGIPSKNDQATKNAAWQFLQFLCGKEVNMEWAEGTGYLPTRNSVLETDEGKQFLEKKPAFQCIFDNLNLINPRIQNSAWSELATTWKNYMEVIMNQDGDVNSNSEDMVTEIDEILADHA